MKNRLKVIKNEKDYRAALAEFERLLGAADGSEEAEDRDVLAVLIEKYEEEHYPIAAPDPIDAVKFRMEQAGLERKDLVPYIGSRSKVSEILSGKRELTLKMIRALHEGLGIPAEILLKEPKPTLPEVCSSWDFERFPVKAMEKNGAFRGFKVQDLKDRAEEAILWLVAKIGKPETLPAFSFRKTDGLRLSAKLDRYALLGWSLQVLAEAKERKTGGSFHAPENVDAFLKALVNLSVLNEGPRLAAEYLAKWGIVLIAVRHLPRTYLDGAAFLLPDGTPAIALTLRYDRIDNFWFVLLHELGHILLGHLSKDRRFFADDVTLRGSKNEADFEKEADRFAEQALLPESFDLHLRPEATASDVAANARSLGVHPAVVAGRIQHLRKDYKTFSRLLGRGEVKKWFFD